MKTETYQELKARQSKEFDGFEGIFFAFNDKQFQDGMKNIGYDNQDNLKDKIVSIGCGGYLRKDRVKDFTAMRNRHHEEEKQRKQDKKYVLESLVFELRNHEFCVTHEVEPALNVLGYEEKDIDPALLKKACAEAVAACF